MSTNEMLIRDTGAMLKFADELTEYQTNIKQICDKLSDDTNQASQYMKDDKSKEALEKINTMITEILNSIPTIDDISEPLKRSATILNSAEDISF